MAKTSPTQNTLKFVRKMGMFCEVTEHWNSFVKRKKDLFGFCDILAIRRDGPGCLAIQATSKTNMSHRRTKILSLPAAKLWIEASNLIWVMGWFKNKSGRWEAKIDTILIGDFSNAE